MLPNAAVQYKSVKADTSLLERITSNTVNTLLISYDLVAPGRNYQPVYDYMEGFTDRMKPLQTVYLVQTSKSAKQIRDDLQGLVDANDKVLVIQVSTSVWATYNLPNTAKWLEKH